MGKLERKRGPLGEIGSILIRSFIAVGLLGIIGKFAGEEKITKIKEKLIYKRGR